MPGEGGFPIRVASPKVEGDLVLAHHAVLGSSSHQQCGETKAQRGARTLLSSLIEFVAELGLNPHDSGAWGLSPRLVA